MTMGPGAGREFATMLAAACHSKAALILFFPPDNMAIQTRYRQGDAAGLEAFKARVRGAVAHHNAACPSKASLFDFLTPNPLTSEKMQGGISPDYVDLVHFRPPAGLWLLRRMGLGVTSR
jgi:hypothetical protein